MQHYSLKAFHDNVGKSNWAKVNKFNWVGSFGHWANKCPKDPIQGVLLFVLMTEPST